MCCQGSPTEMMSLLSPQQQQLQNQMIQQVMKNMGKGATAYPGAVTPGVDPLQFMAANVMMNLGQGRGYTAPPMLGAGGMAGIGGPGGGAGGGGGGGTMPYRDWGRPRTAPMVSPDQLDPNIGFGVGQTPPQGMPYGPQYPAGWDALNDPSGWKKWFY
jgi:hypothetical protein